jgi:hypothetical protein
MDTMEMEQQQQQLHRGVFEGIARLTDPRHRDKRHKVGISASRLDRRSLEHLVNFLDDIDSHEVVITELELFCVHLSEPSDGGLDVLRAFFSRSDTTMLTKVTLWDCNFGNQEDASQLLAAFETNRTVTDFDHS